jgi:hypothetical protein
MAAHVIPKKARVGNTLGASVEVHKPFPQEQAISGGFTDSHDPTKLVTGLLRMATPLTPILPERALDHPRRR